MGVLGPFRADHEISQTTSDARLSLSNVVDFSDTPDLSSRSIGTIDIMNVAQVDSLASTPVTENWHSTLADVKTDNSYRESDEQVNDHESQPTCRTDLLASNQFDLLVVEHGRARNRPHQKVGDDQQDDLQDP